MPLLITRKPVQEMQADMMIHIQDAEKHGNFLQRCIQSVCGRDRGRHARYISYTPDMFEKNYLKALKYAVRRGYKTVAVSCENESAFAVVNRLSKVYAEDFDLQIWLCLTEDIPVISAVAVELEKFLFPEEKYETPWGELEFFESIAAPYIEDSEECYEDCAIWEEEACPAPHALLPEAPPPRKAEMPRPQAERPKTAGNFREIQEFLRQNDAGFKDTLLKYIDRTGKKDSEIYKKANIDRRLFSKIMNVQGYNPSKPTAIAFAIALELNLEETKDLIGRAGYTLSQASTFDRIIEFFILERNYDIYQINEALFYFDQSLLGC